MPARGVAALVFGLRQLAGLLRITRECGGATVLVDPMSGDSQVTTAGQTKVPSFLASAYNCPRCGVLANQTWSEMLWQIEGRGGYQSSMYHTALCANCRQVQIWRGTLPDLPFAEGADTPAGVMVDPAGMGGPVPHADMPGDVADDFNEARTIVQLSPRGACALLRLAVQKLMVHLGQEGKNINADIAALVSGGLPVQVQQALDTLRVVGNNAVHPGEMDLKDDQNTAIQLFRLLNVIVEERIARPREIAEIYNQLPQGARDAVDERDS